LWSNAITGRSSGNPHNKQDSIRVEEAPQPTINKNPQSKNPNQKPHKEKPHKEPTKNMH
jgi:hypothetical protein